MRAVATTAAAAALIAAATATVLRQDEPAATTGAGKTASSGDGVNHSAHSEAEHAKFVAMNPDSVVAADAAAAPVGPADPDNAGLAVEPADPENAGPADEPVQPVAGVEEASAEAVEGSEEVFDGERRDEATNAAFSGGAPADTDVSTSEPAGANDPVPSSRDNAAASDSFCARGPYALGEICIGAADFPDVPWCGCEDGAECTGPPGVEGYGITCAKKGDKCYGVGERCIGAKGMPYVPYGDGCCERGSDCTVRDEAYGLKCSEPVLEAGVGGTDVGPVQSAEPVEKEYDSDLELDAETSTEPAVEQAVDPEPEAAAEPDAELVSNTMVESLVELDAEQTAETAGEPAAGKPPAPGAVTVGMAGMQHSGMDHGGMDMNAAAKAEV